MSEKNFTNDVLKKEMKGNIHLYTFIDNIIRAELKSAFRLH